MFWLIVSCICVFLTVAFFIGAVSKNDDGMFCVSALLVMPTIVMICVNCISGADFKTECINNSEKYPLKVKYVQFHKFFDNTIDEIILLPDQAVLLKDVQIVAKDKLPEDFGL